MKVCILGWYGTETMGDRAILDGAIAILTATFGKCDFSLGSLFPFFSDRTVYQDKDLYQLETTGSSISVFDAKNNSVCNNEIDSSDLVIMGGGPIMDLEELYVVRRAFRRAQKMKITTCLFGCGMGPLSNRRIINVAKDILKNASFAIFRDQESLRFAKKLVSSCNYYCLYDPAIFSILLRKQQIKRDNENIAIINIREQPSEYHKTNCFNSDALVKLIQKLASQYEKIILLPNHTFFIGGDDRIEMIKIAKAVDRDNVIVEQRPLSLFQLYSLISNSKACIGMRYHAVAMQTFLCGNNYIIDYTAPEVGKMSGFINMLPGSEFFKDRYYNYTNGDEFEYLKCIEVLNKNVRYSYGSEILKDIQNNYSRVIRKYINE